jgi:hypothetical protein
MMKPQLELSLEKPAALHPHVRQHRRRQRARWWFDRMRQVVDRALDRRPASEPKPEQIYFSLGRQAGNQ